MKRLLFIADLHLDTAVPDTLALFQRFCREPAQGADTLYILGDLFEAWAGDDCSDAAATTVAQALLDLREQGTRLAFLHGNRDFLLGERFLARCGGELLAEPSAIDCGGKRVVLCHGDSLCTADEDYQQLRAQLRHPATQAALLAQPRHEREALARQARAASRRAGAQKPDAITDVTQFAVDTLLDSLAADTLIHGHTHRPARHQWRYQNRLRQRWVLGAWSDHAVYAEAVLDQGNSLERCKLQLRRFPVADRCGSGTADPASSPAPPPVA